MSVSDDRYTTSKFALKDDAAVDYIKRLVELMKDEANLNSGYLASDAYIELYEYGDRVFKFVGDGFMDSGPDLSYSAVNGTNDEESEEESEEDDDDYYDEHDPIDFFSEVASNLAEGHWFFVENHSREKSYFSSRVTLYHQDGRVECSDSFELKRSILKKLGIDGKVE